MSAPLPAKIRYSPKTVDTDPVNATLARHIAVHINVTPKNTGGHHPIEIHNPYFGTC